MFVSQFVPDSDFSDGRAQAVSQVASRLFGASIGPDAVIDEALRRSTDDSIELADVTPALGETISQRA